MKTMTEQEKALYDSVIADQVAHIEELNDLFIGLYMGLHVSEFNKKFKGNRAVKKAWLKGQELRNKQTSTMRGIG